MELWLCHDLMGHAKPPKWSKTPKMTKIPENGQKCQKCPKMVKNDPKTPSGPLENMPYLIPTGFQKL